MWSYFQQKVPRKLTRLAYFSTLHHCCLNRIACPLHSRDFCHKFLRSLSPTLRCMSVSMTVNFSRMIEQLSVQNVVKKDTDKKTRLVEKLLEKSSVIPPSKKCLSYYSAVKILLKLYNWQVVASAKMLLPIFWRQIYGKAG